MYDLENHSFCNGEQRQSADSAKQHAGGSADRANTDRLAGDAEHGY